MLYLSINKQQQLFVIIADHWVRNTISTGGVDCGCGVVMFVSSQYKQEWKMPMKSKRWVSFRLSPIARKYQKNVEYSP
jgi:hypothetical protein